MRIWYKVAIGAMRPTIQRACEQICIVRHDRGRHASGDPLLVSALSSAKQDDIHSALIALRRFRQTPDLHNQHQAIVDIAARQLRLSQIYNWMIVRHGVQIIYWVVKFALMIIAGAKGDPLIYPNIPRLDILYGLI